MMAAAADLSCLSHTLMSLPQKTRRLSQILVSASSTALPALPGSARAQRASKQLRPRQFHAQQHTLTSKQSPLHTASPGRMKHGLARKEGK